MTFSHLTIMAI